MRDKWYSCARTAGAGDAVCLACGGAVLATPVPPAAQILCDRCFDAWYADAADTPCAYCGEEACEDSCTGALLAREADREEDTP